MINLSNDEIAKLFEGKDAWHTNEIKDKNIPSLTLADGPNGLRIEEGSELGFSSSKKANAYPVASCIANSFDEDLMYEYGEYLANECLKENVDILLGPGINHKRSPIGGRNFEYLSEDPILTGKLASAYIKGVQSKDIGVCLKHYACNSCEMGRMVSNSIIDTRTLNEIYLRAFDYVIKESKPYAIMNSYNLINGIYSCENKELMDHAKNIGFDGIFISDWGGVNDPVNSFKASLNLQMPGGNLHSSSRIIKAINNKEVDKNILDDYSKRFNDLINKTKNKKSNNYDEDKQLGFILKAAEESVVLLENKDNILPLNLKQSIKVYGPYAKYPRFTGAGSSNVNAIHSDNLLENLDKNNIKYTYNSEFKLDDISNNDIALVILALDKGKESEGFDRSDMYLQANQVEFINELSNITNNIIVILQVGSPVSLPFKDKIKGLIYMSFAGCESGKCLFDILYGKVNPSGKLAETWPIKLEDNPSYNFFNKDLRYTVYKETILTGYRYYDYFNIPINYSFGYGLSYTSFKYSNFKIKKLKDNLIINLDITNLGKYNGKEIIEIYSSLNNSKIFRENKKLIGFKKVYVPKGKTTNNEIIIPIDTLSYFDIKLNEYSIEEGTYTIMIASNINDIKYSKDINIKGNIKPYSLIKKSYFKCKDSLNVSDEDYKKIYGKEFKYDYKLVPFTSNTVLKELNQTKFGSKVYRFIMFVIRHMKTNGLNESTIDEAPIRQLLWFSKANNDTVDVLVDYLNNHSLIKFIKVIRTLNK